MNRCNLYNLLTSCMHGWVEQLWFWQLKLEKRRVRSQHQSGSWLCMLSKDLNILLNILLFLPWYQSILCLCSSWLPISESQWFVHRKPECLNDIRWRWSLFFWEIIFFFSDKIGLWKTQSRLFIFVLLDWPHFCFWEPLHLLDMS